MSKNLKPTIYPNLLRNQIDKCLYLTRKEQKNKIILEKQLNDLKTLLNENNRDVSEISLAQHEKYANIKNKIDIKTEILIDDIHTRIDVSHRIDTVLKDIHVFI